MALAMAPLAVEAPAMPRGPEAYPGQSTGRATARRPATVAAGTAALVALALPRHRTCAVEGFDDFNGWNVFPELLADCV